MRGLSFWHWCLLSILFSCTVVADPRDTKATRACQKTEIDEIVHKLAQGRIEWSAARWQLVKDLFECADGTFVSEKRLVAKDPEKQTVTVRFCFKSAGVGVAYAYGESIGLVTDCSQEKSAQ